MSLSVFIWVNLWLMSFKHFHYTIRAGWLSPFTTSPVSAFSLFPRLPLDQLLQLLPQDVPGIRDLLQIGQLDEGRDARKGYRR